jgi:nucleoside 2-deoxyribosyltransferase
MTAKLRCYVASPLGFSEAGRTYYEGVLLPALQAVVVPVDPWSSDVQGDDLYAAGAGEQAADIRAIGRRNAEALESCRLLVAVLDGQEVDSGTASEVGFGAARGLTCFGLRTDYRETGEPGATVNLQVESFILASGGQIVASLAALVEELKRFTDEPAPRPDLQPSDQLSG